MSSASDLFSYLKETFTEWQNDDAFRQSASLAYYSIFSLPALLIIIITVASMIWSEQYIQNQLTEQISNMIGSQAANQVQTMITNSKVHANSTLALIVGIATLIFGATGVFYQLQKSLNEIWEVEQDPDAGIKQLAISRITAFGLIIAIGFLLIVSLLLTAALSAMSGWLQQQTSIPSFVFYILEIALSIGIMTVLFAIMFKVLPDAKVGWQSVWIGAFITAILFTIGKFLLGIYFGKADPASTFGAAGSIVLILLWVYYSGLILFFGAEFTQVYARKEGHQIQPSEHARHSAKYRLRQLEEQQG